METLRKTLNIDGLAVDYYIPCRDFQNNGSILMIHGMWSRRVHFYNWANTMATRGYSVLAMSLRGHDGSRPVSNIGSVSLEDYLEDIMEVVNFMRSQDYFSDKLILLGHSMGGLLAQKMAERVLQFSALVLAASAAPRKIVNLRWPVIKRIGKHLPNMFLGKPLIATEKDLEVLLLNRIERAQHVDPVTAEESGKAAKQLAFSPLAVDERLINCPVLVLAGSDDPLVPVSVQKKIAAKYDARYMEFPHNAHMMMVEDGWLRIITFILDWLQR